MSRPTGHGQSDAKLPIIRVDASVQTVWLYLRQEMVSAVNCD